LIALHVQRHQSDPSLFIWLASSG